MKFNKYFLIQEEFNNKNSEEDSKEKDNKNSEEDVDLSDREETSEEEQQQQELLNKIEKINKKILSQLSNIINQDFEVVFNKIKSVGLTQMLEDFINNVYIDKITNNKEKLFIISYFDEIIPQLEEQFTMEYIT